MTEAERLLFETHAAYVGPVIQSSRPLLNKMTPMPLCVVCPAAQWYQMTDEKGVARLECFCTEFRGRMYGFQRDPVTACDAHADAIDRKVSRNAPPK